MLKFEIEMKQLFTLFAAFLLLLSVESHSKDPLQEFLETHSVDEVMDRAKRFTNNQAALETLQRALLFHLEQASKRGDLEEGDWERAIQTASAPFAHKARPENFRAEDLLGRSFSPQKFKGCPVDFDEILKRVRL